MNITNLLESAERSINCLQGELQELSLTLSQLRECLAKEPEYVALLGTKGLRREVNGLKRHLQSKDWSSIGKADICHVLSTTLFFLQEITEQLATTEEQTNGTD